MPLYTDQDHILATHKKEKFMVQEDEHYDEINQVALGCFINELLELQSYDVLSETQQEQSQLLLNLYNLQFRLKIYLMLLANEQNLINFCNLDIDLKRSTSLLKKMHQMLPGLIKDLSDIETTGNEFKTVVISKRSRNCSVM